MITASVSEEVRRYIHSCKTAYEALDILKELYDSHSKLEIIQFLKNLLEKSHKK